MDFWQLDDIFELLGQNESLHGKRTVVFLSLALSSAEAPAGYSYKNRK